METKWLEAVGGEAGCRRLSADFYRRVGQDAVLRPLFPGKSLRCATEEFAAFLIQFLGGDEGQTQDRWWLSLRESHARFHIGPEERSAWLKQMSAALDATPIAEDAREAFRHFFRQSSAYVMGRKTEDSFEGELAQRWSEQRALDEVISAIATSEDDRAATLAARFAGRPAVWVGLLARMMQTARPRLARVVMDAVASNPALGAQPYGGRSLLHYAAAAGCREVVTQLLDLGTDPNLTDRGRHTPLYAVANGCGSPSGPLIVRALVEAGADVNACGGVTRATPLHMAARRGFVGIAAALLDAGASLNARDRQGVTPLRRAVNCRQSAIVLLLKSRGAS